MPMTYRLWRFRCLLGTLAAVVAITSVGCVPRTFVRKNPDDCDRGIRYYRPKPYLALRPLVNKNGEPVAGHVQISLEYLPDFSEEYSIHIRSGLGINNTSVTLDQGWNLTALNVELDSQTDENVKAAAALLGEVGGITKTGGGAESAFAVPAENVPLGYYEAVIGETCGKKQLYGFRYVGFMPYASCPLTACGTPQPYECQSDACQLYGLVFNEKGAMTFRPLGPLACETTTP
ncbi:MAG: hypothetical protein KDA61_05315 [Planctomycetales bacterium]|nr:hypothetical protein [Planctomycetales bacterium]